MREIDELLETMNSLRNPDTGCPWDRQQSISSILPFSIEEVYELAEAVALDDHGAIRDELGDLLFHIVFYSCLAGEAGSFTFREVVAGIDEKLKRRHPHVFGDEKIQDVEQQSLAWETIKSRERRSAGAGEQGLLDGISKAMPALIYAAKLQKRAASVGFDWAEPNAVVAKVAEELDEIRQAVAAQADKIKLEEEIGDLLFACVNLSRHLQVDAETALIVACRKFRNRFAYIESALSERGLTPEQSSLEEMDALWNEAKKAGK